MITIELLQVMFEAEREQDKARFAELFDAHMQRHEQQAHERRRQSVQADEDRSLDTRSAW
jgi:hypothetical protein